MSEVRESGVDGVECLIEEVRDGLVGIGEYGIQEVL